MFYYEIPALSGGGTIERKFQTIMGLIQKIFGDYSSRELKSITPIADKIEAMADEYKAISYAQLQAKTQEF